MKPKKTTSQHLEEAQKTAVIRVDNARRRYNVARAELDDALHDAAVAAERLRFSDALSVGRPEPKPKAPKLQEQPS